MTLASIALSVSLLLSVEKVRIAARDSFNNTISQTDLIVGARSGPIQLLLYSIFHMGNATNNISFSTYQQIRSDPRIEWTIPYSLGDSHKGFRVVATDSHFYQHYRYRKDRGIELDQGKIGTGVFDVVLGSEVARRLQYSVGQSIVLSHGISEGGAGLEHDQLPFQIVGTLKKTHTPLDRSLYISLQGMEAIHMDWKTGAPPEKGNETPIQELLKKNLEPEVITAFLLRTRSRIHSVYLEREINQFKKEPLLAIIPGVALSQLWTGIGYAEQGLQLISYFVVLSGLLGMMTALYTSLHERRREMAILRAVGARPLQILALLLFESTFLASAGITIGTLGTYLAIWQLAPWIEFQTGIAISLTELTTREWSYLASILLGAILLGGVPAWRAFRNTLSDGLTVRI